MRDSASPFKWMGVAVFVYIFSCRFYGIYAQNIHCSSKIYISHSKILTVSKLDTRAHNFTSVVSLSTEYDFNWGTRKFYVRDKTGVIPFLNNYAIFFRKTHTSKCAENQSENEETSEDIVLLNEWEWHNLL